MKKESEQIIMPLYKSMPCPHPEYQWAHPEKELFRPENSRKMGHEDA